MLKEMAGLGFEWVELSHGIRISLVPGILRAVEEGVVKVASCHNFCPLPNGVLHAAPNLYMPTSRDHKERDQWLRHSKRSLDFAAQVGAKNLVVHLGSIEFFWFNPAHKLDRYLEQHPGIDPFKDADYQKLLTRSLTKLRDKKPVFWENMRTGIAELLPYAGDKRVALGFENRERLDELPTDADYAEFVATIPASTLAGYWHDTGHAHIKEGMGLLQHRDHLEKNAPRAIGFHLHDVSEEGRDHQPVGSGKIDFQMVSEFWRSEHELVIELSPRVTVEGVRESKQRVEALIAQRFAVL